MRMMAKGARFMDVPAESSPEDWEGPDTPPVFSEAFLYDAVGKDDARFILGVAEEYDHLIKLLGTDLTKRLLEARLSTAARERLRSSLPSWLDQESA